MPPKYYRKNTALLSCCIVITVLVSAGSTPHHYSMWWSPWKEIFKTTSNTELLLWYWLMLLYCSEEEKDIKQVCNLEGCLKYVLLRCFTVLTNWFLPNKKGFDFLSGHCIQIFLDSYKISSECKSFKSYRGKTLLLGQYAVAFLHDPNWIPTSNNLHLHST